MARKADAPDEKDARSRYPEGESPEQQRRDAGARRGGPAISSDQTDEIVGFEALFESMEKCRRGVVWKGSVASFWLNGIERCLQLEDELKSGTYRPRPTKSFKVTKPKPRDIVSVSFRDRVYQRSLNDNAVYPQMSKSWIYDNCACQKGKGTDLAMGRLKRHMQKAHRALGADLWALQFDVSGYYPNMRHGETESLLRKRLDPQTADRAVAVLESQYPGDVGYNPGSQIVQICGVSMLDGLDHAIKDRMRAKWYVRYMDDGVILGEREFLEECMSVIDASLSSVGFSANRKKTRIRRASEGIPFLGFTFRLTETGRVLMTLDSSKVREKRRHLRRMVALSKKGGLPRSKVDESYRDWKAHAKRGDTHGLLLRMDRFYKELWKE